MWRFLALAPLFFACRSASPAGELSREECANLVRHVQRLQSADTGGMRDALNVGLRAGIEGCLARGTVRAYDCAIKAESVRELESCDSFFKE